MTNNSIRLDRRTEARLVARELVELLEGDASSVASCLMKAQKLARLLRDSDAQRWLDFEMRGYPGNINLAKELGGCSKYAHRWMPDSQTVLTVSLPEIEANARAAEILLSKLQIPAISNTAANFTEANATKSIITTMTQQLLGARDGYVAKAALLTRMKSHVYRYAADTLVALDFGDVAEDIFQRARDITDEFVRATAPKATEQLLAANERILDGTQEGLSASLTSCRRVLSTVADAIFPPSEEPFIDSTGKRRDVGQDAYLNRLLAYVEQRVMSGSSRSILETQVTHLAARLDAVYSKACKGVHGDVDRLEAQLVLVQTYLFLSEIARLAADDAPHRAGPNFHTTGSTVANEGTGEGGQRGA